MKWIFSLLALLLFSASYAQNQPSTITSTNDIRLPQELRDKLSALKTPEALQTFKYESKTNEMSKDTSVALGSTTLTTQNFSFSNGRIVGQIKSVINNVGYSKITSTTLIELGYQFCCTDKNGIEHCTQDFKIFKQWKKSPENCTKCRTTANN